MREQMHTYSSVNCGFKVDWGDDQMAVLDDELDFILDLALCEQRRGEPALFRPPIFMPPDCSRANNVPQHSPKPARPGCSYPGTHRVWRVTPRNPGVGRSNRFRVEKTAAPNARQHQKHP
jgi:hypothetical protein